MSQTVTANHKVVIPAEQLQKRIREIARSVSEDYRGKSVYAVCVLENGFVFVADLIRQLEVPVICEFLKPFVREHMENNVSTTEIFFRPEMEVTGRDVLIVEGIVQSGVTTDFLIRHFLARGAASVKIATLLDRNSQRRVSLHPDYVGFIVDEKFAFGYGLGSPNFERNLPYIATRE